MVFIAYINLARRTDRRARMEAHLDDLGLTAHRIEALTPGDIDAETLDRHTNRRHLEHVRPNELGCTLSHHAALKAFLATGDSHALILEDDAVLSRQVATLLAEPLDGFDILRLETYFNPQHHFRKGWVRLGDFALYRLGCCCAGAAAYIVNRHAARVLLETPGARSRPYDFALYFPIRAPGNKLRVMQVAPALAAQEDRLDGTVYQSDVQQAADPRPPKPRHLRLPHAIARFWLTDLHINIVKTINRLLGRTTRQIVPVASDVRLPATNA